MRIAQVDPFSFTPPYDHHLAKALGALGHNVELLTSRFLFGPTPEPESYRRRELFLPISGRLFARAPRSPLRMPLKAAEYPLGVHRMRRHLQRFDAQLVHFQWMPWPRYDVRWLPTLSAQRPVVLTAHDVIPRRSEHQLDLWRNIFGSVAHVVVHSSRAVQQLIDFGVPKEKVSAIAHPIFESKKRAEVRAPTGTTLLFFGLLRQYKGLDLLIEALPTIREAVPAVQLIVAGDPVDPVSPLQERVRELGVSDCVQWRLGFVPDDAIAALMAESSAVVLPYRKIASPGVLATALGHGRPSVVSDVGSLGEIVSEHRAGVVVPANDVGALASACVELLQPEVLRQAYEGTRHAMTQLTWEISARKHEHLYSTLL